MSWFHGGAGVESVIDLTESGGRLVGDGLANGGRLLGASIENLAVGAAEVCTHNEPTIKTIQQAARASADLVHDACLVASATIWLLSEIPGQTYHALTNTSQPLQELYLWDWRNINSIINQAILSGAAFITPIPWLKAVVGAFQGVDTVETSHPPLPTYPEEKWYFINGIATDRNWLEKNLQYLEQRFHQPVTGLYNGTAGMTADLVTCVLNRNAHIITKSVRAVVHKITTKLQRTPADRRIRILAHSQGTLILNLALHQLYHHTTETDRKRLLIHTFASCSTDFPDYGYGILEHYANEHDGVSKLGVLDRIYGKRYQGQIYTHLGAAGHLLNTCYSLNARDYKPVPDSTIHPDSLLALPYVPPSPRNA